MVKHNSSWNNAMKSWKQPNNAPPISSRLASVHTQPELPRSQPQQQPNNIKNNCKDVLSIVDDIKDKMSDGDYLKICNLMKNIHNN